MVGAHPDIAPRLGLPELPVLIWLDFSSDREREDAWFGARQARAELGDEAMDDRVANHLCYAYCR